jgi:hypothetical protein
VNGGLTKSDEGRGGCGQACAWHPDERQRYTGTVPPCERDDNDKTGDDDDNTRVQDAGARAQLWSLTVYG